MRLPSSLAICLLAATAVACSSPNPDFCCVTAETCAAAGLAPDDLRPCDVGQACRSYACVAAECSTSADCTSADAPACVHGLCVAGCAADADCAGVAGRPRCDAIDATCVGCTSSDQCPADAAICDAEVRACRGCTADDECASGVCIEATGRCAAESEILYVRASGSDAGTCPKSFPCRTLSFAIGRLEAGRNVIRIIGSSLDLGSSTVYLHDPVIIDGSDTTLTSGAVPPISISGFVTVEGIRMSSTERFTSLLRISSGGIVKLARAVLQLGQIEVQAGGSLEVTDVRFLDGNLECRSGGRLSMTDSRLEQTIFDSDCELFLSSSRLEPLLGSLPSISFLGSQQRIENNIFISSDADASLIFFTASAGSSFRFNTIMNRSQVPGTGYAIWCPEGADVTSNIIAYNSTSPLSCAARHSLFDAAGGHEVGRGIGNRSADVATFFENLQAGDLHLSTNSPALGLGEPGLVSTDFDGNPRPAPTGSRPDVGAYEAP